MTGSAPRVPRPDGTPDPPGTRGAFGSGGHGPANASMEASTDASTDDVSVEAFAGLPVTVSTDGLPSWLTPLRKAIETVDGSALSRFLPPEDGGGRESAVLILFGESERGPEILLTERAGSLRSHAGQPSFPGGSLDPQDGDPAGQGPIRAALREAYEETGLDPRGVQVFGVLPRLYIPVSGFVVTPVLGWWREPSPVRVVDPAETARVFTVAVADLTAPENRVMTVWPSGHRGPAFLVASTVVWGFTAGVIDRLLHFGGWERAWDRGRHVPLGEHT